MKNLLSKTTLFSLGVVTLSGFAVLARPCSADDDIAKGKTLYDGIGACAGCHGATGTGDGPAAGALNPKPRNFALGDFSLDTDADGKKGTESDIANIIQNGAQKYGGSMMMTARPDIAEADRKALAKYVLSLKK